MAIDEHEKILLSGVESWNAWRDANPQIAPDLSGINHRQLDLRNANFNDSDLTKSYLRQCDFSHSSFVNSKLWQSDFGISTFNSANLQGANFALSELGRANFNYANLERCNIQQTRLVETSFIGANMKASNLRGATLIDTDLTDANLTDAKIYGISSWSVNTENTIQNNLVITAENEPAITIDNLEVAQFIYLLIQNSNVRKVIDTITSKLVLILGRFTSERKEVLDGIRDELRHYDLIPVLFDFDTPKNRDTHETITTLARMARFIIADITNPKSVPQEIVSIVESLPSVPVQPIILAGGTPWGMFDHIQRYPWVMEIQEYTEPEDAKGANLKRILTNVIKYSQDHRDDKR